MATTHPILVGLLLFCVLFVIHILFATSHLTAASNTSRAPYDLEAQQHVRPRTWREWLSQLSKESRKSGGRGMGRRRPRQGCGRVRYGTVYLSRTSAYDTRDSILGWIAPTAPRHWIMENVMEDQAHCKWRKTSRIWWCLATAYRFLLRCLPSSRRKGRRQEAVTGTRTVRAEPEIGVRARKPACNDACN